MTVFIIVGEKRGMGRRRIWGWIRGLGEGGRLIGSSARIEERVST